MVFPRIKARGLKGNIPPDVIAKDFKKMFNYSDYARNEETPQIEGETTVIMITDNQTVIDIVYIGNFTNYEIYRMD